MISIHDSRKDIQFIIELKVIGKRPKEISVRKGFQHELLIQ